VTQSEIILSGSDDGLAQLNLLTLCPWYIRRERPQNLFDFTWVSAGQHLINQNHVIAINTNQVYKQVFVYKMFVTAHPSVLPHRPLK